MSAFIDCQIVADAEGNEYVSVPDGYVMCLLPKDQAERYADWTACVAVRVVTEGDTIAALEITDDEDWVTSPEADGAA